MLWKEGGLSIVHRGEMKTSTEIAWGGPLSIPSTEKKSQGLFVESPEGRPVRVLQYVNRQAYKQNTRRKKPG